jgi:transposase InsO family protein
MDFQVGATADGHRLFTRRSRVGRRPLILNMIDEHSRICLAIRAGRRPKAKDVVEELTSVYPAPASIRSDNGPEFIAQALRNWCDATYTTTTAYIEPGSPGKTSWLNRMSSTRLCLQRQIPG